MTTGTLYKDFQKRFKLFVSKRPDLVENTLSNIFTMRLIGNKTHGDLAEIGITEFIKQLMDGYDCKHVGKEDFRKKGKEEDVEIISLKNGKKFPISLKAYGDGPLQLSTDKYAKMFDKLKEFGNEITDRKTIQSILCSEAFLSLESLNVMPLIYREDLMKCNIMVFDFDKMKAHTTKILRIDEGHRYDNDCRQIVPHKKRKYPIYVFLDKDSKYICEIRYGAAAANALQRGFWTNTKKASTYYFDSLTNGWISYKVNTTLVQLIRLALNSTENGHKSANIILQTDIDNFKQKTR